MTRFEKLKANLVEGTKSFDLKQSLEAKLVKLKDRMMKERELNEKIIRESEDSYITYGSEVQIMHRDSSYFLTGTGECAHSKRIGYNCELSDWFSHGMVFKLLPKFKSKEIGEFIQIDDSVLIQNVKTEFFLNFDEQLQPNLQDTDMYDSKATDESMFRVKKLISDPDADRRLAFFSQESECTWRLKIHLRAVSKKNQELHGGDILRLKHAESKTLVGADLLYDKSESAPIFALGYTGRWEQELNSLDTLWEIEHLKLDSRGEVFTCERFINRTGEESRLSTNVRLKHFLTGRYLDSIKNNNPEEPARAVLSGDYNITPSRETQLTSTIIQFEPLMKGVQELSFNFSYYVNCDTDYYLKKDHAKVSQATKLQEFASDEANKATGFHPLEESAKYFSKHQMVLSSEYSSEEAFIIKPINEQFQQDILLVRSAIPKLNVVLNQVRKREIVSNEDYAKVVNVLQHLICFVLDIPFSEDLDLPNIAADANRERQMILRHIGMIDLLVDLTLLPFTTLRTNVDDIQSYDLQPAFMNTMALAYTGLKFTIQAYKPNELYTSQWLPSIMSQAVVIEENFHIQANSTLTELLDNNRRILESRINEDLIKNYLESFLSKEKHEKYLVTLTVLCICDRLPIRKNQKLLCNLLLENKEVFSKLNVKIFETGPEVMFFDEVGEEYKELKKLSHGNVLQHHAKLRNYLLQLIKLYSAICYEKNIQGIEILQKEFSLRLCTKIIKDDDQDPDIRAVFFGLIRDLWVNVDPYSKIIIPKQIVLWSTDIKDKFPKSEADYSKFADLISYSLELVKDQVNKPYILSTAHEMRLMQQLLYLLETFLVLGFFDRNELNLLLNNLKAFLMIESSDDATHKHGTEFNDNHMFMQRLTQNQKANALRYTPQETSVLFDDCRRTIVRIFNHVLKIQTELRMGYFFANLIQKVDPGRGAGSELKSVVRFDNLHQSSGFERIPAKELKATPQKTNKVYPESRPKQEDKALTLWSEEERITSEVNELKILMDDSMSLDFSRGEVFSLLVDTAKNVEDVSLKTELFAMMTLLHTQSLQFKEVYTNVLFVHPERMKDYLQATSALESITSLSMIMTKWYDLQDPPQATQLIGVLEELVNAINIPIRVNKYTDKNEEADLLGEDHLQPNPDEERNETLRKCAIDYKSNNSNKELQDILRNIGFLDQLIKILDYDLTFNYYKIVRRHYPLLQSIYKLIITACRSNQVNKTFFAVHEKIFMEHLTSSRSLGVEFLICEVLPYHKMMVRESDRFEHIFGRLAELTLAQRDNCLSKAYLVMAIITGIYIDGRPSKNNQNRIISLLFKSSRNQSLMEIFSSAGFIKRLTNECIGKKIMFDKKKGRYLVVVTPYLCYLTSLLELICSCADGGNSFGQAMAQNMISIDKLVEIMNLLPKAYFVRYSFAQFFYNIYVKAERDTGLSIRPMFLEFCNQILNDMTLMIELSKSTVLSSTHEYLTLGSTEYICHWGVKSADELFIDYLSVIADCFLILAEKETRKIGKHDTPKSSLSDIFIQIVGLSGKFTNIKDESLSEKLNLLKFKSQLGFNEDLDNENTYDNMKREPWGRPVGDNQIVQVSRTVDPGGVYSTSRLVNKTLTSPHYSKIMEQEFEQWIGLIGRLQGNEGPSGTSYISLTNNGLSFLGDTVSYFTRNMSTIDESLTMTGIKLFRKFVESAVTSNSESALEWSPAVFETHKTQIRRRQNLLLDTPIVEWMANILNESNNPNLFDQALLLCIALLYGGNPNAQLAFYNQIISTAENNRLLKNLQAKFDERFTTISTEMKSLNDSKLRKIINESKFELEAPKHSSTSLNLNRTKAFNSKTTIEIKIFRFLQLLCEGHNKDLQNVLRSQAGQKRGLLHKNINLVASASRYLGQLLKFINPQCVPVALQLIDFLIECMHGPCTENQTMLFESKIVEVVKDFMNDLRMQPSYFDQMFEGEKELLEGIVKRLITLLNALLEGNQDNRIREYMSANLNLDFLADCLSMEYTNYLNKYKLKDFNYAGGLQSLRDKRLWDRGLTEAFQIYFLLCFLESFSPQVKEKILILNDAMPDVFGFFRAYSAHVELVFDGGLIVHYFPVQPACQLLDETTKTQVLASCSRESPTEKIKDFMEAVPGLFDLIDDKAYRLTWRIKVNPRLYRVTRLMTLINTMIINAIMFIQFGKRAIKNTPVTNQVFDENQNAFKLLAICHNILSGSLIIWWLVLESRISNMKGWRALYKDWKAQILTSPNRKPESEDDQMVILSLRKNVARISYDERVRIVKYHNEIEGCPHTYNKLEYWIRFLLFIGNDKSLLFLLRFMLASILGLYYQTKGFLFGYSILMLDTIFWFDTMKNVINSIYFNAKQLTLAAILGCIIVYNYSLFAYFYLDETFFNKATGPNFGENICSTVIQCFLTILSLVS